MAKDKLRVQAVEDEDIATLKRLADSTEWYKYVQPRTGNSLLHIAVLHPPSIFKITRQIHDDADRKAVFDYLLSIPDFPFDHKNSEGHTVLTFCLCRPFFSLEYFACALIRRGASLDCGVPLEHDDTLLHHAVRTYSVEVAKLLMEMGHDVDAVNGEGATPLWLCLQSIHPEEYKTELAIALLYNGADPDLGHNCYECVMQSQWRGLQEAFFSYMIDDYASIDIRFEVLLRLAQEKSPFFRGTVERADNVIVRDHCRHYYHSLFYLDVEDLKLLIERCPDAIRQTCVENLFTPSGKIDFRDDSVLENVALLCESDLHGDVMDFLFFCYERFLHFKDDRVDFLCGFNRLISDDETDESVAFAHLCVFLSYGLQLGENQVLEFYRRYGYGELLRIVLHMEIEPRRLAFIELETTPLEDFLSDPFFRLLYDVHCDFRRFLDTPPRRCERLSDLLHYFCDATLRGFCAGDRRPEVVAAIANQPRVPLLTELSRDVCRRFLVDKFEINSARQFYTLVNKLPVAPEHKKIITYETRLY